MVHVDLLWLGRRAPVKKRARFVVDLVVVGRRWRTLTVLLISTTRRTFGAWRQGIRHASTGRRHSCRVSSARRTRSRSHWHRITPS